MAEQAIAESPQIPPDQPVAAFPLGHGEAAPPHALIEDHKCHVASHHIILLERGGSQLVHHVEQLHGVLILVRRSLLFMKGLRGL